MARRRRRPSSRTPGTKSRTLSIQKTCELSADRRRECRCPERRRRAVDRGRRGSEGSGTGRRPAARRRTFGTRQSEPGGARQSRTGLAFYRCQRDLAAIRESLQARPITLETLPPELIRDWMTSDGERDQLSKARDGEAGDNQDQFSKASGAAARAREWPSASSLLFIDCADGGPGERREEVDERGQEHEVRDRPTAVFDFSIVEEELDDDPAAPEDRQKTAQKPA